MYLLTAWPNILYFISRKKLEYLLNSSEFAQSHVSKIVLVFKRFHVESFVWIRHRVEIFILNFLKYRVFTRTHAPRAYLAIYSPMHVQTLGVLWSVESISGFSRPLWCKQRFVLMYVSPGRAKNIKYSVNTEIKDDNLKTPTWKQNSK
jgi:hypothetical protein